MNKEESITFDEQQFNQAVQLIAKNLPMLLYDFFGVKSKFAKYSSKRIQKASVKLWDFFTTIRNTQPLLPTDPPEVRYRKMLAYDKAIRHLIRIPKGMNFIEFLAIYYRKIISGSFEIGYLPRTNYRNYVKEMNELTIPLAYPPKNSLVSSFLQEFDNDVDAQVVFQAGYKGLLQQVKFLEDGKKIMQARSVEKLITVYLSLVGLYEKLIRVALGLLHIQETGKLKHYISFNQPLANNVRQLARKYPALAGINTVIRNATAHHSYVIHYAQKTIDFSDRKNKQSLSFREFLKETRELSARVMTLVLSRVFLLYHNYRLVNKEYLEFKVLHDDDPH